MERAHTHILGHMNWPHKFTHTHHTRRRNTTWHCGLATPIAAQREGRNHGQCKLHGVTCLYIAKTATEYGTTTMMKDCCTGWNMVDSWLRTVPVNTIIVSLRLGQHTGALTTLSQADLHTRWRWQSSNDITFLGWICWSECCWVSAGWWLDTKW